VRGDLAQHHRIAGRAVSASSASAIRPSAPKLAAMLFNRAAASSQLASQRERPSRSSWRATLSVKADLSSAISSWSLPTAAASEALRAPGSNTMGQE
jgi:hypothetical protein